MRKLRIMSHISLDGVMQHSADGGDFPYSDWVSPYRTPAGLEATLAAYGESFDLLLGRHTYDQWTEIWGPARGPMAKRINAATKFVATHHPESLAWGPSAAVGSDLVEGVRRIKAQDGPDLVLAGSSTLISTLLEQGLADDVVLIVYPILLGTGKRFFTEGTPAQKFVLKGTFTSPTGVIICTYSVTGPF